MRRGEEFKTCGYGEFRNITVPVQRSFAALKTGFSISGSNETRKEKTEKDFSD